MRTAGALVLLEIRYGLCQKALSFLKPVSPEGEIANIKQVHRIVAAINFRVLPIDQESLSIVPIGLRIMSLVTQGLRQPGERGNQFRIIRLQQLLPNLDGSLVVSRRFRISMLQICYRAKTMQDARLMGRTWRVTFC